MDVGVDYYPEHWDTKDWEGHAKLMEEGGFRLVRLAEFAWHKMEPSEGRYDFGWLDEAIAVLRRHNIRVILGTPTAAPPPWLVTRYPDTLAVNAAGRPATAGGRRHYCFTSPRYRELSRRIVTVMAQHYADNACVVGWQTDNEIGGPRCWCAQCAAAFREWLKDRYGTTEALNQAWGTVFWGQTYNQWDEIPLPNPDNAGHSSSILLAHARFHSRQVLAYHSMQVDLIRKLCPRHYVTHNCMGFYNEVDYTELGKSLDIVSWDNYPGNTWGSGKAQGAPADYMRSVKHKPFIVMEQRAGLTGWLEMFQSGDNPGQLRLWSFQTVAHGADAVVYFRWRTCRFGTEQYWHGVLDHHGQPGRRYQELSRVAREFSILGDRITGAEYQAPIGVLLDPDSRWLMEIQKGSPDFSYLPHANAYYSAFAYLHAGIEYLHPADDFTRARILVVPSLFITEGALAQKLTRYVEEGGALVLTFRSGVKDRDGVVHDSLLPGPLRNLAGLYVEEYDALVAGETWPVDSLAPLARKSGRAGVWCEQLRLKEARAIARYTAGPFKGSPAAALNRRGKGLAVYVGFKADEGFYRNLASWLLKAQKIQTGISPSECVEVTCRKKGEESFYFVLNHSAGPQRLLLPSRASYRDLLTGRKTGRSLNLRPYEVRVLSPTG